MDGVMHSPTTLPAMPGMLARSLLTLLRNDNSEAEADKIEHEYSLEALSAKRIDAYKNMFGGFVSDIPLSLFYCLAQRTHLAQMLDKRFPWPAPGLVHLNNRLEQLEHIQPDQPFYIKASVSVPARGPQVSPRRLRPKFEVSFYQDNKEVVRCVSTYQVMKAQGKEAPRAKKPEAKIDKPNWTYMHHWQLGSGLGRRYARVSGDFNPIHLHPFTSRWFGFNKPIIHGMYMMARAQADIERVEGQSANYIDVTFKRPVILPARIRLWRNSDSPEGYEVRNNDNTQVQLEGKIRFPS
jgi:acyl dehydratase